MASSCHIPAWVNLSGPGETVEGSGGLDECLCTEADYWRGAEGLELRGLVIYAMDTKAPGEACRHIRVAYTHSHKQASKQASKEGGREGGGLPQLPGCTAGTEGPVLSRAKLTFATCLWQLSFGTLFGSLLFPYQNLFKWLMSVDSLQ